MVLILGGHVCGTPKGQIKSKMNRRQFAIDSIVGLGSSLAIPSSRALLADTQPAPSWANAEAKRDYWIDWPTYFSKNVSVVRQMRKAELASIRSQSQVRERIETIRSKVWKILGGPFDKTPLNARTVGTIDRDAYQVEKVVFESQPEVYVTANLYVPREGRRPFPGIISPLGHYAEGKVARDYQILFQNLARKGYVVLAFDPFGQGERYQFLNPTTGQPHYDPTVEHDKAGWPMLLLGATLAEYLVWDGIRAVDYLVSRPEVDANRIGCVGHSGGATMTMFMCPVEPRIQVAVEVEGHTRNFAGPDYTPPGSRGGRGAESGGQHEAGRGPRRPSLGLRSQTLADDLYRQRCPGKAFLRGGRGRNSQRVPPGSIA